MRNARSLLANECTSLKVGLSAITTNFQVGLLSILRHHWHFPLNIGAAFVEDFGLEFFGGGFGGFAVGVGHGFGVAEGHAGGSAEDFADGPGAVFVGEEDFAVALFFGAIIPAAQEREVVAEE